MADEHLERLLAELGERAQTEIAQVQTGAASRAQSIRDECVARADARKTAALETVDAEFGRRRSAALAEARRRARGTVLRAQHALVDRVLAKARTLAIEQLAQPASECAIAKRSELLRSYAVTCDAQIERVDGGIRFSADRGHLSIDDTVDAWLEADRAAIAIDVCHGVEASSC